MPGSERYRHRNAILPGTVVSAVSYATQGQPVGSHRGLPSPWLTFIVSVDGPVRVSGTVEDGAGFDAAAATSYDVLVAGLHPVAARVEQPAAQQGVQLAVHPLAARTVLGCRAAELTGPGDHGEAVLGPEARKLHDRVAAGRDGGAQLDQMQHWLRRRVGSARSEGVRPELWRAWQLAEARAGRCTVESLAADVLLSPRQLRALMLVELGVSPKQLLRLFRFDQVVARLADGGQTLAEIAVTGGYADQSHLTREFRCMAGCSPTEWLAEERRNIQDGGHRNRPDWLHD